jgi:hypothetical protein
MKHVAAGLVMMMLAGCVSLAKDYPERKRFALRADRAGEKRAGRDLILKVRRFRASAKFDGTEFVMRRAENGYESDFYHVFFDSPAALAAEESKRWLAASGLFAHVVDFSSHVDGTHVLEGNVSAIYADRRGAPKGVLELQLHLIDDRATPPSLVFSKTYSKSVDAKDESPESLVEAWNRGLGEILAEAEGDLAGVVK